MSSTGHRAQLFLGRPGPRFSPPAIVPNIIRRVSSSGFARCTAPEKSRRRLRIVALPPSHCALLRAFAYDMRWSVRCRRWKPVVQRRSLRYALWSSTAKCSTPRVQVTHPCSDVSITSDFIMRAFNVNEAVSTSYDTHPAVISYEV